MKGKHRYWGPALYDINGALDIILTLAGDQFLVIMNRNRILFSQWGEII
jgi:hypothetical protein